MPYYSATLHPSTTLYIDDVERFHIAHGSCRHKGTWRVFKPFCQDAWRIDRIKVLQILSQNRRVGRKCLPSAEGSQRTSVSTQAKTKAICQLSCFCASGPQISTLHSAGDRSHVNSTCTIRFGNGSVRLAGRRNVESRKARLVHLLSHTGGAEHSPT